MVSKFGNMQATQCKKAEQSQLFQPDFTGEVLQPSDHLGGPSLDLLQEAYVPPVQGTPELDAVLQIGCVGSSGEAAHAKEVGGGSVLFNVFVSDRNSEIECTLSKFTYDMKLNVATDTLEGWDAIHRDLDKLEKWAHENIMKSKMYKAKVLHLS
ncbi:hypothetical protein BTVI_118555 [Pitangus sulphuratus]|nr:hypothetical protein BTVI_118555 [Pitangus sulphuratus]